MNWTYCIGVGLMTGSVTSLLILFAHFWNVRREERLAMLRTFRFIPQSYMVKPYPRVPEVNYYYPAWAPVPNMPSNEYRN